MTCLRRTILALATALAAMHPAAAQQHGHAMLKKDPQVDPTPGISPYAELQERTVKALSDAQMADLRAGRGMGLALTAELNGYPGPVHVLEFADELQLSHEQRIQTKQLMEAMTAQTVPLGERIIAEEAELNRMFAGRRITQASLKDATSKIGTAQGMLRAAHLRYHLEMIEVLTPAQISRYAELRGYAERSMPGAGIP